jgi:class 3 adenylate cyclase
VRGLGRAVAAVALALAAVAIGLAVANRESITGPDDANAIQIVLPIGFGILGGLVTARQPGNPLGWVTLAIAVSMAISGVTGQYTRFALVTQPDAPFTPWIALAGQLTEIVVYPAGLAALAILISPNGRFLSPAWRWVALAGLAVTAVLVIFTATEVNAGFDPAVPNPAGLVELARLSAGPVGIVAFLAGLGVLLLAGVSLAVRLHRSSGEERQQLRWVAAGTAVAIVANAAVTVFAIGFLDEAASRAVITVATTIGFGLVLPASFGVAILRYRLYDLDLLLNRTVLYGAVTVVLAAALFGANLLVQAVVDSDAVIAVLGVAAGMAFSPMRTAVRPLVDRLLPPRSRLTLLFTDIVESTQAIVDLGDERWRERLVAYREVVRRELARWRGREVNTAGDAFFAVFSRPVDGVRCAIAIREAVGALGLRVRTGLHLGEVETRGEEVSGLAVHAAARVMALAGADQVFVTDAVADVVGSSVALRELGSRSLRGVPGEWRIYEVGESGAA